jgi:phosphatidate cytidylyltransferase
MMSPTLALADGTVLTYVVLVGTLMLAIGLLLVLLTYAFGIRLDSVWRTYRSWLVMVPIVLAVLVAGRVATILSVAVAAIFAFREFAHATGLCRERWTTAAVYVGIAASAASSLVEDPWRHVHGWYGLFMALPVYVVSLVLVVPIARNQTRGQLHNAALAVLGFIYIGWMFSHIGFLANSPHAYGYLMFLLLAVEGTDVAAFTSGKLLGRRKLREAISPNKTWGGALGALAFAMALPWLLWFSFPHFGWLQLVLAGLIVGVGGQLGDLTLSMIKRDIGVKDMGRLIPGHGGLLDRVDSLIFAAPLFLHMVRWFYDVY